MEDYLIEMKLSRAFACEFEKFCTENRKLIPSDLFEAYMSLKQHYQNEIEKNIS